MRSNNTRHASRQIGAPRWVSFFLPFAYHVARRYGAQVLRYEGALADAGRHRRVKSDLQNDVAQSGEAVMPHLRLRLFNLMRESPLAAASAMGFPKRDDCASFLEAAEKFEMGMKCLR